MRLQQRLRETRGVTRNRIADAWADNDTGALSELGLPGDAITAQTVGLKAKTGLLAQRFLRHQAVAEVSTEDHPREGWGYHRPKRRDGSGGHDSRRASQTARSTWGRGDWSDYALRSWTHQRSELSSAKLENK